MTLTPLLMKRVPEETVVIHPTDAEKLALADSSLVTLKIADHEYPAVIKISSDQPENVILVSRSSGIPLSIPAGVQVIVPDSQPERGAL